MAAAPRTTVVVPCFNEEARLREEEFVRYLSRPDTAVRLLFVDDGSSDGTVQVLERIVKAAPPSRAALLPLTPNGGKAEAVRRGMLQALEQPNPATIVGFWDCDLATPLEAIQELVEVLQGQPWTQMVFGARVALLNNTIRGEPLSQDTCKVTKASTILATDDVSGAAALPSNTLLTQMGGGMYGGGYRKSARQRRQWSQCETSLSKYMTS